MRNIDNGIESGNPTETPILKIQSQHIAHAKRNIRIQSPGLLQHSRRKIQPKKDNSRIAQIACDLPGPTTHGAYFAASGDLRGETPEQLTVQRLVLKFVKNSERIFIREPLVAFANWLGNIVVHDSKTLIFQNLIFQNGSADNTKVTWESARSGNQQLSMCNESFVWRLLH